MTTAEENASSSAPRIGSAQDLSRRMDRVEQRQEDQAREIASLGATVQRVEQNQSHASELNKLRFDALDAGVKGLGGQLADFMKRIEGMISGEVETVQTRQGREILEEYKAWRVGVEERLDTAEKLEVRVSTFGRTLYLLTIGGGIVTVCAIVGLIISVATIAGGHPTP